MFFDPNSFYVIPSVRQLKDMPYALSLDVEYIHFGQAHIGNLQQLTSMCHQAGKKAIVNLDLMGGLGSDKVAMKLLKQLFHVDVVIAASTSKINMLLSCGIEVIQRITLMDSLSIDSGVNAMKDTKCTTVELRPGIYSLDYFDHFSKIKDADFIMGGFVNNLDLLEKARAKGFRGVATSSKELWTYNTTK